MSDPEYAEIALREYNLFTPEYSCKATKIASAFQKYDYRDCDDMFDFAQKKGMAIRGHNLVWAKLPFQPDFIKDETDPAKIEAFMADYIATTMTRYKGKAVAWDVLNEAFEDDGSLRKDSVYGKVNDYACKSFQMAHQADPDVKLFYNDYGHYSMTGWGQKKSDAIFNLIKDMKARGCPIHGVGFQMHLDVTFDDASNEGFKANLKRYEELNVDVHITEL